MLNFETSVVIATLLSSVPLFIVARTVYFAWVSKWRFAETTAVIRSHDQPKNEDGEAIQLRLRHAYAVGGKEYTGRRYYFGSRNESNSDLLRQYPVGSHHSVFYDTRHPRRSTLRVGFHPRLWFWILAVLAICPVLWIAIVVGLISQWKVDATPPLP